MKYAIISDIHGNNMALQNVMNDAKTNGADAYIFAGDYCVCSLAERSNRNNTKYEKCVYRKRKRGTLFTLSQG